MSAILPLHKYEQRHRLMSATIYTIVLLPMCKRCEMKFKWSNIKYVFITKEDNHTTEHEVNAELIWFHADGNQYYYIVLWSVFL